MSSCAGRSGAGRGRAVLCGMAPGHLVVGTVSGAALVGAVTRCYAGVARLRRSAMEHVKLTKLGQRRPGSGSGVRCWMVAAALALTITVAFLAIVLWLGMNAATRLAPASGAASMDPFPDLPPPLTHKRVKGAPNPEAPPPLRQPPERGPLPKKRNKGQVEKVRLSPASEDTRFISGLTDGGMTTDVPETAAHPSPVVPSSSTTSTTTTTSTTSTTTTPKSPLVTPMIIQPTRAPPSRDELPVGAVLSNPFGNHFTGQNKPTEDQSSLLLSQERHRAHQQWPSEWAPSLTPSPSPRYPPARAPVADLVAEAAGAAEWRMPADRREGAMQEEGDSLQPHHYDGEMPEEAENPVFNFVQDRLQGLRDWMTASNADADWQEMLQVVNASLYRADPSLVLRKLKDMYYNASVEPDVPLASLVYPTDPSELSNSTSLVSFGLLAFDLLLLRNVQLLARGEDGPAGERAEQLLQDPEVRALSALFLPPQEVRQQLAQTPGSAELAMRSEDSSEELTLGAVLQEVASFLTSGLRAVLNLGRAYSATMASARRAQAQQRQDSGPGPAPVSRTPLDCLWTLYCRSLDKTARLSGPYGFLARMNGLGLRLLLGVVPVERALDLLVKEATTGRASLDCAQLFPRCSAEDAVPVALDTALGRTPVT